MEGSNDSNKRKGDGVKDGTSGGKKLQKVTTGMEMFDCSICFKRLAPPIFQDSNGNRICLPCHEKLPESERADTWRSKVMERAVQNFVVTREMGVFDCSICSKPLGPPIFQCSKGNPICSNCRDKLPESDGATAQRCYIMERVVDNIFVPCKYGCNRMPKYYKRDAHKSSCTAGPCVCPVSGCGFVALNVELLDHLTTIHKLPKTPIEFFVPSELPVKTGCQLLCSKFNCVFLLDVVSLESIGHAIYLDCIRPETPLDTVQVILQFSRSGRHLQVSKLEIAPDDESRQCLCVLPHGEPNTMISIEIQMVYIGNGKVEEELQREEEDEDDEDYQDYDDEEVDD